MSVATYEQLVERGCLCGSDRIADCPLHRPGDNRGLAAYFKAGHPLGFPMVANCMICDSEGLMYPDIEIDDPKHEWTPDAPHHPTLVCPRCSTAGAERRLVTEAQEFGYKLNERRVFGLRAVA